MRRPAGVKPILFFSLSFLFASLAEAFCDAEVQSRARRFCAAKRTLDGFSAPRFNHAAKQRETLFHSHAAPLSLPYALSVWTVRSPVQFEILDGGLPP